MGAERKAIEGLPMTADVEGAGRRCGVVSFSDWLLVAAVEGDNSNVNRTTRFRSDVDGFRALATTREEEDDVGSVMEER